MKIDVTENLKARLTNSKIMIVDHDSTIIDAVQFTLTEEGYTHFIPLADSRRILDTLESSRPDLLLIDLHMPEMSGFDVLLKLQSHPNLNRLPVIISGPSGDPQNKLRAAELGAADFLTKPLDRTELVLRVRNTLFARAFQDQLAYYDPLTNLPNRRLFLEELKWSMNLARRHDEKLALVNIEIDNFAHINDTIGILAGDEVLKVVSQRIQKIVRDMDILGRAMGDEETEFKVFHFDANVFFLQLNRIKRVESSAYIAERILKEVTRPIAVGEQEIFVTASIGIATYPDESEDLATLLKLATSAKDYAKVRGGGYFEYSSRKISEIYEKRLRMEIRLRKAVENNDFALHYQPKVDLGTGRIAGVEALVRLPSADGLIYPNSFIELAEETGLIIPLGKWCLIEGCRQLKEWQDAGKAPVSMSINLSAKQFSDDNYVSSVKQVIGYSGIDPGSITLELTESLFLEDIEKKILILRELKEFGVKLSIDDFGTGYSSLSYLRRLPVDELKIDRSFVMDVTGNAASRAIVSTIIFLAKSLNLSTVAEGIEQESELAFLQEQNCDQYQGFLFSRPIPGEELTALLPAKTT